MSSNTGLVTQHGSASGLPLENQANPAVISSRPRDPSPSNDESFEKEDQFVEAIVSVRALSVPQLIDISASQ